MRRLLQIVLWSACASTAFAQLESYTVTVSATRTLTPQPDQVGIGVTVTAPVNIDVLSLVQPAGITVENLDSVYSSVPTLNWSFTLTVPLSNLNATLTGLTNVQRTLSRQNSTVSLSFSVNGLQVSPQLQASQQCPLAGLVSDARTQAQTLAQAAGFTLGSVSAMSLTPAQSSAIPSAAYRIGALVGASAFLLPPPANTACTVAVKFKLTAPPTQ